MLTMRISKSGLAHASVDIGFEVHMCTCLLWREPCSDAPSTRVPVPFVLCSLSGVCARGHTALDHERLLKTKRSAISSRHDAL